MKAMRERKKKERITLFLASKAFSGMVGLSMTPGSAVPQIRYYYYKQKTTYESMNVRFRN